MRVNKQAHAGAKLLHSWVGKSLLVVPAQDVPKQAAALGVLPTEKIAFMRHQLDEDDLMAAIEAKQRVPWAVALQQLRENCSLVTTDISEREFVRMLLHQAWDEEAQEKLMWEDSRKRGGSSRPCGRPEWQKPH